MIQHHTLPKIRDIRYIFWSLSGLNNPLYKLVLNIKWYKNYELHQYFASFQSELLFCSNVLLSLCLCVSLSLC